MGQASAQIPLLLMSTIPLDGRGFSLAILLPVSGMAGTPFPGAVAADFAILGIAGELLLPALTTTLQLAWLGRARSLLRVKSRGRERPFPSRSQAYARPGLTASRRDRLAVEFHPLQQDPTGKE
jgi:hypothetical protein